MPVSGLAAAALPAHLESARDIIAIAGRRLFGARDRGEALTSAIATRNWLDEGIDRKAFILTAGDLTTREQATGVDREVALRLVDYEKSGQLRFSTLPEDLLVIAPRLSFLIGKEMREYYASQNAPPVMEGALAGVGHRSEITATESWLVSVRNKVEDLPGPLAALTDPLRAFRFKPGQARKIGPLLEPIVGRRISIRVEDPWCGARPQNRERLASFLRAFVDGGVELEKVTIIWNPDNLELEPASGQMEAMRSELRRAQMGIDPIFVPRTRRDGHFHDRLVVAKTLDEGASLGVRWDITSGIDNLMAVPKECSVFLEIFENKKLV